MKFGDPIGGPLVVGCIAAARRRRVEQALAGVARPEWHESFAAMSQALARSPLRAVVLIDAADPTGAAAGPFASGIAAGSPDTPIVLYATQRELLSGALSSPGFTDLVIVDETDATLLLRGILLRAVHRVAAERVARALRERLSPPLATFADAALRNPSCGTVELLADRLGVHRQTIAGWCRRENSLRPEELLMWCRVLLASAVLTRSDRSVSAIAMDLDFPSPVSLRNQLKRYTGLTAMEIRAAGLDRVMALFDRAVEDARGRRPEAVVGAMASAATPRSASA